MKPMLFGPSGAPGIGRLLRIGLANSVLKNRFGKQTSVRARLLVGL